QTIGFKPEITPEDHASFFTTSTAWGLFSQTQNQTVQTAELAVKFGSAQIKNIVLATPGTKTGSSIKVKLDGVEQVIKKSKQDGNTLTINLKSTSEVKAGSSLRISLNIKE
ncbi:hypothetical protein, partial [uncultured Sunxiuqinia sp.]|uniref:hypothetical protein n=1 Tax=uncultured Sunxiuqinia sp. TaxID=1573825 RepID=UPI0030D947B3